MQRPQSSRFYKNLFFSKFRFLDVLTKFPRSNVTANTPVPIASRPWLFVIGIDQGKILNILMPEDDADQPDL